jgi:hypothetical protein
MDNGEDEMAVSILDGSSSQGNKQDVKIKFTTQATALCRPKELN